MGSDHAFLWRAREQELHILAGWLLSCELILISSFHSNISSCKDVPADFLHFSVVMLLINSIHSINVKIQIECPKRIAYRWHVPHSELSVLCGNSINLLLFDQSYCWSLPAVIVFINKIIVIIIVIIISVVKITISAATWGDLCLCLWRRLSKKKIATSLGINPFNSNLTRCHLLYRISLAVI